MACGAITGHRVGIATPLRAAPMWFGSMPRNDGGIISNACSLTLRRIPSDEAAALPQLDAAGACALAKLFNCFQRRRRIIGRRKQPQAFHHTAVADEVTAIFQIANVRLGRSLRLHDMPPMLSDFEKLYAWHPERKLKCPRNLVPIRHCKRAEMRDSARWSI